MSKSKNTIPMSPASFHRSEHFGGQSEQRIAVTDPVRVIQEGESCTVDQPTELVLEDGIHKTVHRELPRAPMRLPYPAPFG